ncbi:MAG: hypothetical protein LUC51_10990, partial [Cloacibacillus porcorum]|nr:hypothetical protein [Cloacibacillus porcorum]
PHICYDKRAGWNRFRGSFDMSVTEAAVCGIRDRGTTNRPPAFADGLFDSLTGRISCQPPALPVADILSILN